MGPRDPAARLDLLILLFRNDEERGDIDDKPRNQAREDRDGCIKKSQEHWINVEVLSDPTNHYSRHLVVRAAIEALHIEMLSLRATWGTELAEGRGSKAALGDAVLAASADRRTGVVERPAVTRPTHGLGMVFQLFNEGVAERIPEDGAPRPSRQRGAGGMLVLRRRRHGR
jgi:hypothetical protein